MISGLAICPYGLAMACAGTHKTVILTKKLQRFRSLWDTEDCRRAFANDHLDAFFNASVDAAIALSSFVIVAEAEGLGVCPISAVRNHAATLARLLRLPSYVFPVAGLAVGYPAEAPQRSHRLPLSVTLHYDAYSEDGLDGKIDEYDRRRSAAQPHTFQRYLKQFGPSDSYGWSEDKARQYAFPERQDFGAYVREIGFKLE